jgi:hypothetical protein
MHNLGSTKLKTLIVQRMIKENKRRNSGKKFQSKYLIKEFYLKYV